MDTATRSPTTCTSARSIALRCVSHTLTAHARVNWSRVAPRTYDLEYNRIIDDVDGTASYEVDLPSGGDALLRGNVIVQSARSPNHAIVSYAHEKQPIVPGRLTLVHNTIYNRRSGGQYVVNKGATPALLINNLFSGSGGPGVSGDYEGSGNLTLPVSSFVDARGDDFRLAARSPAIDSAVGLKGSGGGDWRPGV